MSLLPPSIECASNIKMLALNAVKQTLSDRLNGLARPEKAKAILGDLIAKGNAVKAQLLVMVPQLPLFPPPLPNFKDEFYWMLANISNQVAFAAAAAALEKKWGKAIGLTLIKNLIAGAATIDLCKDIPNIDGKLQSDGTMIAVPKSQASPIPSAPPADIAALVPTVKSATTLPSSGLSGVTRDEYIQYLTYNTELLSTHIDPIYNKEISYREELATISKSSLYKNLMKKMDKTRTSNINEYRKGNVVTQQEATMMSNYNNALVSIDSIKAVGYMLIMFNSIYAKELSGTGDKTAAEYLAWHKTYTNDNFAVLKITARPGNSATPVVASAGQTAYFSIKKSMDENKALITKGEIYSKNQKAAK